MIVESSIIFNKNSIWLRPGFFNLFPYLVKVMAKNFEIPYLK